MKLTGRRCSICKKEIIVVEGEDVLVEGWRELNEYEEETDLMYTWDLCPDCLGTPTSKLTRKNASIE